MQMLAQHEINNEARSCVCCFLPPCSMTCVLGNPNRTCIGDLFTCFGEGRCISPSWVCDGDEDCMDGSDEHASLQCGQYSHITNNYSSARQSQKAVSAYLALYVLTSQFIIAIFMINYYVMFFPERRGR